MPKDRSQLQKKQITDKDGVQRTVWVRAEEAAKKTAKRTKEAVSSWKHKQEEEFKERDPEKEKQRKAKNFFQKKADGIVKSLKSEVGEWREGGNAVGKLVRGESISRKEKKALATVTLHTAFVAGTAIMGSSSADSFAKNLAVGFLEHTGVLRGGQALIFAKAEEEEDNDYQDPEQNLKHLIQMMAQYIEEEVQENDQGQLEQQEQEDGQQGQTEEEQKEDEKDQDSKNKKESNGDGKKGK